MVKEVKKFRLVFNQFGKVDEQASIDACADFVGGKHVLDALSRLSRSSYPSGTQLDFLYGHGKTQQQVFNAKALAAGYSQEQIDAYLLIGN